ncbi:MAG: DUF4157 domain-containing protein [Dehalococcoidia bacterium]|nr:DUF4157 domain-containing protein [Dehalococcoidia bacterium]
MNEYKRRTPDKKERPNQGRRPNKNDSRVLPANPRIRQQGEVPIAETPYKPAIDDHSALLAQARSDVQRANLVSQLQQSYGNTYVQRLLSSMAIQAKLTVNTPNDIYEQEADRVADTVTRAISSVQRQEEEEEELQMKSATEVQRQEEEEEELQMKSAAEVHRQEEEEEEELQMKLTSGVQQQEEDLIHQEESAIQGGVISEGLEARINTARGAGRPLPESVRASFEPHFERDFSNVRVHTNPEANELSRQLGAKAFTTSEDIFFRDGTYQPDTDTGRNLLAHELTHVVQQKGTQIRRQKKDTPAGPEEPPKTTKDPKEIANKVLEAALQTEEGKKAITQLKKGTTKEGAAAVDALTTVMSALFAANMDLPKAACALIPKLAKIELDKDIELGFQPIYKGKLTGKPNEWGGMVTLTIKRW